MEFVVPFAIREAAKVQETNPPLFLVLTMHTTGAIYAAKTGLTNSVSKKNALVKLFPS